MGTTFPNMDPLGLGGPSGQLPLDPLYKSMLLMQPSAQNIALDSLPAFGNQAGVGGEDHGQLQAYAVAALQKVIS